MYPQTEADREIKGLRVHCLNEDKGCGWIGELSVLIKLGPRDTPIPECKRCKKCNVVIHYTNLTSHFTTDCLRSCQYCKITAERRVIDNLHMEKCHKYPLPCPNQCGLDEIPRDGMDKHKAECPLEVIQCHYCKAEITRKDKENHDNENKIKHFQMMCDKPLVIKPKLIVAMLCVLIAILAMTFSFFMENKSEMQQLISVQDHDELQTELSKLNYLRSLAMNIYKSCKNLYDHMSSEILWSEMIFLCDEMSLRGDQVAPVIVKILNYTEKMKNKTQWYSSPFFTFEEGYKVQIRVDPAIYSDDEITYDHVFVYLFLLKGPYDDKLIIQQSDEWPTKGTFTVELLNQLNDSDHLSSEVAFTCNAVTCNFKAAKLYSPTGHLTSHETICYQITSGYLQHDSLYFRISYKDTRYDYYHYYHLIKYILSPPAAVATVFIINGCIVDMTRLKKSDNVIMYVASIVGSLLVSNLLGGVLWGVITTLTSGMILNSWEKFTGKELPVEATLYMLLVISIPANVLVVDVFSMPWNIIWLIV